MFTLALIALPLAAIKYSLVYLLLGGGFFGAVIIFLVAKMFGKSRPEILPGISEEHVGAHHTHNSFG